MIEKIEGIVTGIVRHNDNHNIVTLYTRTRGRMAFLVPLGKSKSGRMRNAVLSLMAVVSADVRISGEKELYPLRQINPERLWYGIYSNPVKSSILFFITEFCNRLIRQYPSDQHLWNYLINSLEALDRMETGKISNFHLAFLILMLPLVGIQPSPSGWEQDFRFDMISGEMVDPARLSFTRRVSLLSEEESRQVGNLLRMNFQNMACFRFTSAERNLILDRLLAYYSIHLPLGGEFKSLDVLREFYS